MSEGVAFRKHVRIGWRSAACKLFAPKLSGDAVDGALRAAARDLRREGGMPGIHEIVHLLADDRGVQGESPASDVKLQLIDRFSRQGLHANTLIVAQRARMLVGAPPRDDDKVCGSIDELTETLVEFALRDYLAARVFPTPLLAELIESGHWDQRSPRERRREFFLALRRSVHFRSLVQQLVADPTESRISMPLAIAHTPDIADLVFAPLTRE